jgi:predicted O-methyltransferase YrrM
MAKFYNPEPNRDWIVHPVFEGNSNLSRVLDAIHEHPDSPGHSDVGIQNLLYTEILNTRPRRVLEIGTHIGTAAVIMATALEQNGYGKLLTLEPQEHFRNIAHEHVRLAGLDHRVEILPCFSYEEECRERLRGEAPFEVIFIDGAHEYEAALFDIELCYGLLADNGAMLLHDVGVRSPMMDSSGCGGVRQALYDFANRTDGIQVIFKEHPLWLNDCGAAIVCKQVLEPAPSK